MNKKFTTGYIQKVAPASSSDDDMELDEPDVPAYAGSFVLNEESPDRMGDVIVASGWDLANFKRNPIALWMHESDEPIGTWENVKVAGKQLVGDLKLGTNDMAQMTRKLIEEGILRAVSVGFRVLDYEPMDQQDPWGPWLIKAAELLEVSAVSIPAHPNALRISKEFGLNRAQRELIFGASSPAVQIDPAVREKATHPAVIRAGHILADAQKSLR
jgi:HK97 family phage prohead protease